MNEAMRNWSTNPTNIDIKRSKQKMRHSHKTTYDLGQLVPIYWREVLPGSTVKMNMSEVTRMQTPIFPIMDTAMVDTMFFFVPNRLVWTHWEEFMGENKTGYWEQPVEYEVPQIVFDKTATKTSTNVPSWIKGTYYYPDQVQAGSLADYMGIPISDANLTTPFSRLEFSTSALPFRAYFQVFNDWFRDENVGLPIDFDKGDSDITAVMGGVDPEAALYITPPPMVYKFHDYFTSALPQPQKHDDVTIGLAGTAPLIITEPSNLYNSKPWDSTVEGHEVGMDWWLDNGNVKTLIYDASTTPGSQFPQNKSLGFSADLAGAGAISINTLRQAFAVQRYYERQARGGSRYIEQLKSMFGVTSPDARLQRSEYLGGCRRIINIDQVVQTSSTDATTPQGNVAAYSMTTTNEELFTKSFVEHGILIGVQCVRVEHSYQDGINKMFIRRTPFDYYNPVFANIGEMPIYNKEIFAGTATQDEAFGYQEAWAEYRYMNNRVSGEFRSHYHQSLDAWHFADNYAATPSLSYAFLQEYPTYLNRNIATSAKLANQFMSDIFFEETWTQPMPLYSIPGLLDHN